MTMRATCLGCDRTVEGKDFLRVADMYFPVCADCQDQLASNDMALRAALREILRP